MSDMSSLLSKMTETDSTGSKIVFTDAQVSAMVEVAIPRIIQNMPGMDAYGLKCTVERNDDGTGWTIHIDKPL